MLFLFFICTYLRFVRGILRFVYNIYNYKMLYVLRFGMNTQIFGLKYLHNVHFLHIQSFYVSISN